jgi:cobalamin biosynthesis Mg chelatase CobN
MYQLNLGDKNLYASLENDDEILSVERTTPEWSETHFSETNLAPFVAYDNGDKKEEKQSELNVVGNDVNNTQPSQPEPVQPSQSSQAQSSQSSQSYNQSKASQQSQPRKRSVWGFIKFALIVVLLALIVYFTIYRIGWGISECSKRNYHDCAALLTPELSSIALASIAL